MSAVLLFSGKCARDHVQRSVDWLMVPLARPEHWKNDENFGEPEKDLIYSNTVNNDSCFSIEELNEALKSTKNGKQPGPDNLIMELIKWLDKDNREIVLNMINGWWSNEEAPNELFDARVVPIYKKGETDNAANYRPISL